MAASSVALWASLARRSHTASGCAFALVLVVCMLAVASRVAIGVRVGFVGVAGVGLAIAVECCVQQAAGSFTRTLEMARMFDNCNHVCT